MILKAAVIEEEDNHPYFSDLDYRIKEDEIMKAINLLKKNKAPGLDNLTNELIIAGKQSLEDKAFMQAC